MKRFFLTTAFVAIVTGIFYLVFKSKNDLSHEFMPQTLFYADFNDYEAGKLSYRQTKKLFNNALILCGKRDYFYYMLGKSRHPLFIQEYTGISENSHNNRFLAVLIPENQYGPIIGASWKVPLTDSVDECFLSYRLMFSDDFDFVKGGKLPGMAGGTANTGGSVPNGEDGFSVRMMFWEDGKLSFYIYHPEQKGTFGDRLFWKNKHGDTVKCVSGEWHTITHYIKLNEKNKKNGILNGWLDGELVYSDSAVMFRTTERLKIDQFLLSVFLGGNDISWASDRDGFICFDNFLVSKGNF